MGRGSRYWFGTRCPCVCSNRVVPTLADAVCRLHPSNLNAYAIFADRCLPCTTYHVPCLHPVCTPCVLFFI